MCRGKVQHVSDNDTLLDLLHLLRVIEVSHILHELKNVVLLLTPLSSM